jgi:hypothetical protein
MWRNEKDEEKENGKEVLEGEVKEGQATKSNEKSGKVVK